MNEFDKEIFCSLLDVEPDEIEGVECTRAVVRPNSYFSLDGVKNWIKLNGKVDSRADFLLRSFQNSPSITLRLGIW